MDMLCDQLSSDGDSDGEQNPPKQEDACYRCKKIVYPVERVNVGNLFHRRCFRCRTCGLQLTLRTFRWDQENHSDVYCHVHAPKHVGRIDHDSMGIKSALNAPKRGANISGQTRGSVYNPGWQYDANAMEFNHHRELYLRGKHKTTSGTYKEFEESGIFVAQSQLERVQKIEEDILYDQIKEERERKIKRLEDELMVEKDKSVRELVSTIKRRSPQKAICGLERETEKLEEHFKKKREENLRSLMDRMSSEQKTKVALMIQKHSQAMLLMIAERLMSLEERSSSDSDDKTSPICDLSRPPPISPPEFRRSQLFKSPSEFEEIDNHVFQVVQNEYSAFTDLVKDLILGCETDLEKARAIFRWITCKDLNKLDVCEPVNPESPLGLLRGIKYGTETYHDLFKRLCSFAGLYCEVIQGYSKGAGYKPGMKLEGEKFRNAWTAVSIDGSWCFINCNWGARHVKGNNSSNKENKNQYFYEGDEFYFITNPEDHIFQHFPNDSRWQLLECPISLTEFISLPIVKSSFFNYGLKFIMHYDCKQYSKNGLIVLQLKIPNILGFGYTLDPKDKCVNASQLEGRVMLCIIGHKAIFTVAPPKPGKYYFTIFAKDDWCSESLQSACAFELKCRERKEKIKSPYPKVSFFGPTPSMSLYGLVPKTHIDPIMVYSHDDIIIQFELHLDVKLSHSLCYHGNGKTNIDYQRYVFIKHRDFDTVCYQIRCPTMGKFVFSLFGSRVTSPNDTNNPLECLFRYLIECKQTATDKRPLPRACHRWCGADLLEPKCGDIGLEQLVTFRVRVPAASDVAVLIGDAWFHFHELADSIWEGTVLTGKRACIAKLYGRLNKIASRFSPLLEFQVK